jgi:hypothetical protein
MADVKLSEYSRTEILLIHVLLFLSIVNMIHIIKLSFNSRYSIQLFLVIGNRGGGVEDLLYNFGVGGLGRDLLYNVIRGGGWVQKSEILRYIIYARPLILNAILPRYK